MADTVRLGVVGCGKISDQYLGMAKNFPAVEVSACADLDPERARAQADKFGVPRALSVEELLKSDEVDIVLNLTVPKAHVPVGMQCIENGKHMYAEKPLGIDREEGRRLVAAATEKNLRIGCAPDTFMGAGIQTARKIIDDGTIGQPIAFTAFNMGRGPESWHPSPEFYYEVGGGPMFDMGPYYLTALLNLLGPIRRVGGVASIAIPDRTITSQPKSGKKIRVETQDHICGTIEFENGAVGTIITSFATMYPGYDGNQPITIFGTEGTLRVPDPNQFDGPVHFRKAGEEDWTEAPAMFVRGYGRSIGVADMACAIRSGRPHRAGAEQAFTVLDVMQGFLDSSNQGKDFRPSAPYQRPAPMPANLPFGVLDE